MSVEASDALIIPDDTHKSLIVFVLTLSPLPEVFFMAQVLFIGSGRHNIF